MAKIIGIDLGTTNSCIAIMDGDTTKVIENSFPATYVLFIELLRSPELFSLRWSMINWRLPKIQNKPNIIG